VQTLGPILQKRSKFGEWHQTDSESALSNLPKAVKNIVHVSEHGSSLFVLDIAWTISVFPKDTATRYRIESQTKVSHPFDY